MPYDNNNIFAKIIRGEIPCRLVYKDDKVIAFEDVNPAAKTHVLVLPIGDYKSLDDFTLNAPVSEVGNFFRKVRDIGESLGLNKTGYRIIANHGKDASQTVPHFHVHILGGESLGGLIEKDKHIR